MLSILPGANWRQYPHPLFLQASLERLQSVQSGPRNCNIPFVPCSRNRVHTFSIGDNGLSLYIDICCAGWSAFPNKREYCRSLSKKGCAHNDCTVPALSTVTLILAPAACPSSTASITDFHLSALHLAVHADAVSRPLLLRIQSTSYTGPGFPTVQPSVHET